MLKVYTLVVNKTRNPINAEQYIWDRTGENRRTGGGTDGNYYEPSWNNYMYTRNGHMK